MPVYNGEKQLDRALKSISAQTFHDFELIVVDDGSTDSTPDLIRKFSQAQRFPVRYIFQENSGPAASRNRGIEAAGAKLLAFLDCDDAWINSKLELQLETIKQNPQAQIVMGRSQRVKISDHGSSQGGWRPLFEPRVYPHLQCALIRKGAFEIVGPLNETLRFGEDLDWFLRAWEAKLEFHIHSDLVAYYCKHQHNASAGAGQRHLLIALQRSLHRRKKIPGMSLPPFLDGGFIVESK